MIFCTKRSSSFSDFLTVEKFISTKCLKGDSCIQSVSDGQRLFFFGGWQLKKKKMIYHLSKLVPLRGYPAVKRHESFTKLKAPCAAYYLHSHPGESRTSLAVQHCHFFKWARKKPVENMWNLRVTSSTIESENHSVQPHCAILRCLPGTALGSTGLAVHRYLPIKPATWWHFILSNGNAFSFPSAGVLFFSTVSCLQIVCLSICEKYTEV